MIRFYLALYLLLLLSGQAQSKGGSRADTTLVLRERAAKKAMVRVSQELARMIANLQLPDFEQNLQVATIALTKNTLRTMYFGVPKVEVQPGWVVVEFEDIQLSSVSNYLINPGQYMGNTFVKANIAARIAINFSSRNGKLVVTEGADGFQCNTEPKLDIRFTGVVLDAISRIIKTVLESSAKKGLCRFLDDYMHGNLTEAISNIPLTLDINLPGNYSHLGIDIRSMGAPLLTNKTAAVFSKGIAFDRAGPYYPPLQHTPALWSQAGPGQTIGTRDAQLYLSSVALASFGWVFGSTELVNLVLGPDKIPPPITVTTCRLFAEVAPQACELFGDLPITLSFKLSEFAMDLKVDPSTRLFLDGMMTFAVSDPKSGQSHDLFEVSTGCQLDPGLYMKKPLVIGLDATLLKLNAKVIPKKVVVANEKALHTIMFTIVPVVVLPLVEKMIQIPLPPEIPIGPLMTMKIVEADVMIASVCQGAIGDYCDMGSDDTARTEGLCAGSGAKCDRFSSSGLIVVDLNVAFDGKAS